MQHTHDDHWIKHFWRPAMAVQYFFICFFDFMFAPIFLTIYCSAMNVPYIKWVPLTLEGGGLYHLAMGAILGISAWSRGQEKMNQPTKDDANGS